MRKNGATWLFVFLCCVGALFLHCRLWGAVFRFFGAKNHFCERFFPFSVWCGFWVFFENRSSYFLAHLPFFPGPERFIFFRAGKAAGQKEL